MRAAYLLLAPLLACASAAPAPERDAPPPPARKVVVVATNDLHGWLVPHEEKREDGVAVQVGGLAVFASYLAALRAEDAAVVLVDGGDLFQGTLASNLTEGASVIEAYNALGYDAAALGNHEFDFGPAGPAIVAGGPDDDALGALVARASEARFPFLAANVTERTTGKPPPWLKASILFERRGVKIGVVGLATEDTPSVTVAANVASLAFGPPAEAALREATALRARGAQVVILVAHIGGRCETPEPEDCEGELLEVVRKLPPGTVDAVAGGHTHRVVATRVNGTPIVESGAHGRAFGIVEQPLDQAGRVAAAGVTHRAGVEICELHVAGADRCDPERGAKGPLGPATFRGKRVARDEALAARLAPHLARVAEVKAKPLGTELARPLRRDYDGESDVGDLVADAILAAVPEADLAVTNSGGLRADLPDGPLTFGHAFEVIPFDNRLALVELSGAELLELLRIGFTGVHGGLQVAGARVEVSLGAEGACAAKDLDGDGAVTPYDRARVKAAWVRGKPVDPKARYKVATNDFLASGGSGWNRLLDKLPRAQVRPLDDRPILRDTLVKHVSGRGRLDPAPKGGRITLDGPLPRCAPGT